jgi:hypothetical protein
MSGTPDDLSMINRDETRAAKTYLLACGCAATVSVSPGQAGGEVACPRCGAAITVPRLGELARLPTAAPEMEGHGGSWTTAHGCVLGGSLAALLAVAAASYLSMAPQPPVEAAMIRAGVAAASTTDIYKAWQALARSGVSRPTMADEDRIARAVAGVLWTVAAIGAAVAIGGGMALARGRDPKP